MKAILPLLVLLLGSNLSLAAGFGSGGMLGGGQQRGGQVIAQGPGGQFTSDALNAYIEALEFCLAQVGQPQQFSGQERQQIAQTFAQGFAGLPIETQQGLVGARATWNQYQASWNQLGLDQKKAFAYDVLSLAYGEQAAAQALGMGGGSGYGGDNGGGGGGGYSGWSEPCYTCTEAGAMTYEGGMDMGDGTFSYD